MKTDLRATLIVLSSVALATLLTFPISHIVIHSRSLLFIAAVIVTARYAGAAAGLCTSFLSVLVFDWFFDSTPHVLDISWAGALRVLVFAAVSLLVASLEEQRRNAIVGLQETNRKLLSALDEVKILRGILTVCSYCKQVRTDAGDWHQLESYIREHSEAEFSHGICPDCLKIRYPDIYERKYGKTRAGHEDQLNPERQRTSSS